MNDLAEQVRDLETRIEDLTLQIRQIEIAQFQSEMHLQLQIRSLSGNKRVGKADMPSLQFVRDTLWKRMVFRKTGKPRQPFKLLLFKGDKTVRRGALRIVFKKNGNPRPCFVRWMNE